MYPMTKDNLNMKTIKYKLLNCVQCLIVFILAFALHSPLQAEKLANGKKLFETKCSQCHTLDYPRSERHDHKGWTEKVERMRLSWVQPEESRGKGNSRLSNKRIRQIN